MLLGGYGMEECCPRMGGGGWPRIEGAGQGLMWGCCPGMEAVCFRAGPALSYCRRAAPPSPGCEQGPQVLLTAVLSSSRPASSPMLPHADTHSRIEHFASRYQHCCGTECGCSGVGVLGAAASLNAVCQLLAVALPLGTERGLPGTVALRVHSADIPAVSSHFYFLQACRDGKPELFLLQ